MHSLEEKAFLFATPAEVRDYAAWPVVSKVSLSKKKTKTKKQDMALELQVIWCSNRAMQKSL